MCCWLFQLLLLRLFCLPALRFCVIQHSPFIPDSTRKRQPRQQNGFTTACQIGDDGARLAKDMAAYFKKRQEIENHYAKALSEWTLSHAPEQREWCCSHMLRAL